MARAVEDESTAAFFHDAAESVEECVEALRCSIPPVSSHISSRARRPRAESGAISRPRNPESVVAGKRVRTCTVFVAPFRAALTTRVARKLDRASIFGSGRAASAFETAQCSIAADGRRGERSGGRHAEWCRYFGSSIQS